MPPRAEGAEMAEWWVERPDPRDCTRAYLEVLEAELDAPILEAPAP